MSHSNALRQSDVLTVMRHLADVASLKGRPADQRHHLLEGLNEIVGTNQGMLFVCEQWRPNLRPHFVQQTLSRSCDQTFLRYAAQFGIEFPLTADPFCDKSIGNQKPFQTWTMRDVFHDAHDRRHYRHFGDIQASGRVRDGLVTMYRDGADAQRVIGFGLHRFGQERSLAPRQIRLAEFALKEVRLLVERGHLALLPDADAPELPARLKEILDALLTGQSPKAIARKTGLSLWTVREHIQRLYRRFNVNGREELMARFVRLGSEE